MIVQHQHFPNSEALSHQLSGRHRHIGADGQEPHHSRAMRFTLFSTSYVPASITNKILLAKYLLYLPDKDELRRQLDKLLLEEQWHEPFAGPDCNE